MERTFHMLLYRAFHAQRTYLWPSLNELGLGSGAAQAGGLSGRPRALPAAGDGGLF